jgi:hypothetical protein
VIDSTGLDAKRRAGWRALAARHHVPAVAVVVNTPAAVVRSRNRARAAPVPTAVVTAQLRELVAAAGRIAGEGFAAVHEPGPVTLVPPSLLTALDSAARQREDPAVLDFGLQTSRFGWPGHPATTAATLAEVARAAEEGFTSLWVMDHMLQIPQVGREWDMLETHTSSRRGPSATPACTSTVPRSAATAAVAVSHLAAARVIGAREERRRQGAATVEEHVGRYRELADAGVQTAIVGLSDEDGPESVRRFADVVSAFRPAV